MIQNIIIICVGALRYKFDYKNIQSYDFNFGNEFGEDLVRIDFRDGSHVTFQKENIICIEVNKGEGVSE